VYRHCAYVWDCCSRRQFGYWLRIEPAFLFAIAVLDCVYFQDSAVTPRLVGAGDSDLKFFSGLRFQTAFIFETTVWNRSPVRECTGLRFETAFLFASRNLSVNHLCVSTPRIVDDSICDIKLIFASWHQKRLGPRQATILMLLILSAHLLYCVKSSNYLLWPASIISASQSWSDTSEPV